MDKILQAEVFVNKDDGQLRVAHLILGYTPISHAFQAPKCVIKAHDPCLHRISIADEGFLLPEDASLPESVPLVGSSSFHPWVKEEEEKTEREEEIVKLVSSKDEFEVFNRALSPEDSSCDLGDPTHTEAEFPSADTPLAEDVGIQRKKQLSLLDLIESQPRRETHGRPSQRRHPSTSQSKLPLAPSKLPLPPPKSTLSLRTEPFDTKRKKESKGKKVMEAKKSHPTPKEEAQRVAKQQKVGPKEFETRLILCPSHTWLPVPMLNGAPLMDNASIRDF